MAEMNTGNTLTGMEIAVIGMSGRFPAAGNIEEFWDNLKDGVESISFFSDQELEEYDIHPGQFKNANYVKAKGVMQGIEYFDASFFGHTPEEAENMDPQMRILLECSWNALEDAGYDPESYDRSIGIYGGASVNNYWETLPWSGENSEGSESLDRGTLTNKDYLTASISYKFNLKGPAFTLFTACSTSLVAIHLACQGLLGGECDMALAGGVSITLPKKNGYLYREVMITSPDGHCRVFDTKAYGTVYGNGVGIVVLKRLDEAIAADDTIYAVVKGSFINNDGNRKVGFTALSVKSQTELMQTALHLARVEAESIGYIEAHGTGTVLGDPIEIEALTQAFNTGKRSFCAIGSVKSNVGHLDCAAGVTGFIKTVLVLKYQLIPPTLHFENPNPEVDFENSPFYVNGALIPWKRGKYPLRAGVSAFGIGGTNAHVILEEAPENFGNRVFSPAEGQNLIVLSAKTSDALERTSKNLADYFKRHPDIDLADAVYTLQVGRRAFQHRKIAVCSTVDEAIELLSSPTAGKVQTSVVMEDKKPGQAVSNLRKESWHTIGRWWLQGYSIDWQAFYANEKRYRIPLPGYAFDKQRYWKKADDQMFLKKTDIEEWFYIPYWIMTKNPYSYFYKQPGQIRWLVFMDESGVGSQLVEELNHDGMKVIGVRIGTEFVKLSDSQYALDPSEGTHYDILLAELQALDMLPTRVVHLWGVTAPVTGDTGTAFEWIDRAQDLGYNSLVHLARAIAGQGISNEITIVVITNNVQEITGGEALCPEKAAVLGPVRVIPMEYPNIKCRNVDIVLPLVGSRQKNQLISHLLKEINMGVDVTVSAYRGNRRWEQSIQPVRLDWPGLSVRRLRKNGVYLVTSGLQDIGLASAEYLGTLLAAKVVLVEASDFPSVDQWDQWQSVHDKTNRISQVLGKVKELESQGIELLVFNADMTSLEEMQTVIQQVNQRFGTINGVLHSIEAPGAVPLQQLPQEIPGKGLSLSAQIKAAFVLDTLLEDAGLDFFILYSSLASVLAPAGQVELSALSAFFDAFAHYKTSRHHTFTVSINWDEWQFESIQQRSEKYLILPEEGRNAFLRILDDSLSQVMVSTRDLLARINRRMPPESLEETEPSVEEKSPVQQKRPNLANPFVAPTSELEQTISNVWKEFLGIEQVGVKDNFFELGATSRDIIQLNQKLKEVLEMSIPVVTLFACPTVSTLAEHLHQGSDAKDLTIIQRTDSDTLEEGKTRIKTVIQNNKPDEIEGNEGRTGLEIAVIGMSGRFPGAKNIDEFWKNLKDGIESISFFSTRELAEAGVDPGLLEKENYVKAKGFLEDIEYFDAALFDYRPGEAEKMDPQVRIFHECAWEALENAGIVPERYNGAIGLYAGATNNFHWEAMSLFAASNSFFDYFEASHLNDKDFLSTRISYKLNLTGPSLSIHTACSTSLVAIHLACEELLTGRCDMALAGGVSVTLPQKNGYLYHEGMIQSEDGHCKAFDAEAKGMIFGDGIGIVVLKRLENAIKEEDFIHAIIKGTAINNDGSSKVGYTAPSVEGQAQVIRAALQVAEIEPESIGYIEAHGTGTPLGDPIEIEALKLAFNTQKKGFCRIGSVKTNIGHLNTAAGVTGLIKTVLVLKHKLIPASLNFKTANPKTNLENSPFYVNTALTGWKTNGYPLRAGVSSFGFGGTNAHVILEEWPSVSGSVVQDDSGSVRGQEEYQLILLSAKSESALDNAAKNLAGYLKENPCINLADVAYTLQVGRKTFRCRRMMVCVDLDETIDSLASLHPEKVRTFLSKGDNKNRPVVFMFPGQGAQYVNMGLELYRQEPEFRKEMDRCFKIVEALMGYDIKEILYPTTRSSQPAASSEEINQTGIAQPLLFTFEYALTKLLMKWGIKPRTMIGHSIGEYVTAHLSGVFSLEDALKLVVSRGTLMQQMPGGAMLSVPLCEEELKPLLTEEIALAAVNGPSLCVVSGSHETIDAFEEKLREKGHDSTRLHTSHAFHSKMMDPILQEFEENVKQIKLNDPQIQYLSNVTGKWITAGEVTNPAYWSRHLRDTVRFGDEVKELLKEEHIVLVEVGPGRVLSTFVKKHPAKKPDQMIINLVRHPREKLSDLYFLLDNIGQLWLNGIDIDWFEFYSAEKRKPTRIPLPAYPFEQKRFWIDKSPFRRDTGSLAKKPRLFKKPDTVDWFYIPRWVPSEIKADQGEDTGYPTRWLLFIDAYGLGSQLVEQLEKEKKEEADIIVVKPGSGFTKVSHGEYIINPERSEDYNALFIDLQKSDRIPDNIVHLWNVTEAGGEDLLLEGFENIQTLGLYSLLDIVRTIGKQGIKKEIRLNVVTNHMQNITGKETLCPAKATVLGPVKVIPKEYTNITCRSIDVVLPETGTREDKKLIQQLLTELTAASDDFDPLVAYRGDSRMIQTFEPKRLEKSLEGESRLRERGVYMITGGLGGIGYVFAEYLVKTVHARLILVGRSDFPGRDDWEKWLNSHDKEDPVSRKIRKVRELETLGGEILVFAGDVSCRDRMQVILEQAEKRFGPLNGVCHTAGAADYGGVIQRRSREITGEILAAKIRGTLVLDRLLKDAELDFFILCSSLSSILGPFGEVGYCAANAFLDAFAHYKGSSGKHFTVSINWDAWQDVGMAAEAVKQAPDAKSTINPEDLANYGILPAEGIDVFRRVLHLHHDHELSQLVVSTTDLGSKMKQRQTLTLESPGETKSSAPLYQRPDLSTTYAAPGNKIEKILAEIWQDHLGIKDVGIYDNFFELGANSLDILQVNRRLDEILKRNIPVDIMFEYSTIDTLAVYLKGGKQNQVISDEKLDKSTNRMEKTFKTLKGRI